MWKGGGKCYYGLIARKVMEQHLGRKLKPGETVHHIDFDYTNNVIDNLHLFPDGGKHTAYHEMLKGFVREAMKNEGE